jgi:hypothetical protein
VQEDEQDKEQDEPEDEQEDNENTLQDSEVGPFTEDDSALDDSDDSGSFVVFRPTEPDAGPEFGE